MKRRNVSTDFRAYRHAPAFVNSARLQNLYPEVIAHGMEQLFRVDGGPKRKILPLARRLVRQFQIKPGDLLRDGYHLARAYLW